MTNHMDWLVITVTAPPVSQPTMQTATTADIANLIASMLKPMTAAELKNAFVHATLVVGGSSASAASSTLNSEFR